MIERGRDEGMRMEKTAGAEKPSLALWLVILWTRDIIAFDSSP